MVEVHDSPSAPPKRPVALPAKATGKVMGKREEGGREDQELK